MPLMLRCVVVATINRTSPSRSRRQVPVTQSDVETEQVIRKLIAERFPDHGFYGEETGSQGLDAEYLWLVDPIDGTKAFVREYPISRRRLH